MFRKGQQGVSGFSFGQSVGKKDLFQVVLDQQERSVRITKREFCFYLFFSCQQKAMFNKNYEIIFVNQLHSFC